MWRQSFSQYTPANNPWPEKERQNDCELPDVYLLFNTSEVLNDEGMFQQWRTLAVDCLTDYIVALETSAASYAPVATEIKENLQLVNTYSSTEHTDKFEVRMHNHHQQN